MSKAEEKAVRAYTDHEGFTFKEERKAFVKGYEQAEKDTIERACEWLEQALTHGCHPCSGSRLVMEFRKAMEDKK